MNDDTRLCSGIQSRRASGNLGCGHRDGGALRSRDSAKFQLPLSVLAFPLDMCEMSIFGRSVNPITRPLPASTSPVSLASQNLQFLAPGKVDSREEEQTMSSVMYMSNIFMSVMPGPWYMLERKEKEKETIAFPSPTLHHTLPLHCSIRFTR